MLSVTISSSTGKKISGKGSLISALDLGTENFFKDVQSLLVSTAKSEFAKAIKNDGFDPKAVTFVDSRYNGKVEQVRPLGKIEYVSRVLDLVPKLRQSYDLIEKNSPEKTGNYKSYNYVLFNGQIVAKNRFEWFRFTESQQKKGWKDNDDIVFINITPYARKLERYGVRRNSSGDGNQIKPRGRFGKKKIIVGIPNGAYEVARRAIRGILRGAAIVDGRKFDYNLARTSPINSKRTTFKSDGRPYQYPVIKIRIKTTGVVLQ